MKKAIDQFQWTCTKDAILMGLKKAKWHAWLTYLFREYSSCWKLNSLCRKQQYYKSSLPNIYKTAISVGCRQAKWYA